MAAGWASTPTPSMRNTLITLLAWVAALATVLYQRGIRPLALYIHHNLDLDLQPKARPSSGDQPSPPPALPPAPAAAHSIPSPAPAEPPAEPVELHKLTISQLKQLAGVQGRHSKRHLINLLTTQSVAV